MTWGSIWVSTSASLQLHTDSFDRSVEKLHGVVATHHGYLEDLRTESRSGNGRTLSASISVPSADFEVTLADLKTLGRIEAVSEAGEDSVVKLASAKRHLAAAQTNLSRLKKLERERKGELRDALALEKDIAQANEAGAPTRRAHFNGGPGSYPRCSDRGLSRCDGDELGRCLSAAPKFSGPRGERSLLLAFPVSRRSPCIRPAIAFLVCATFCCVTRLETVRSPALGGGGSLTKRLTRARLPCHRDGGTGDGFPLEGARDLAG